MASSGDLPFRAEYAKSSRAMCKKCGMAIAAQTFRIARMEKSRAFDGYEPKWYHAPCILRERGAIKTTAEVDGFNVRGS